VSLRDLSRPTLRHGHTLTTEPASEPVTAAELRTYLVTNATILPDSLADDFVKEARQYIERVTGLALINQTWTMELDRWPQSASTEWWSGVREGAVADLYAGRAANPIEPPRYPLSSVTSVSTFSEANVKTAITVSDYFITDTSRKPGRIVLKSGKTWPTATRTANAIKIVYVAGYGATESSVPAVLKRAVKQFAGALSTHRGDGCSVESLYSSSGAADLVAAYSVTSI